MWNILKCIALFNCQSWFIKLSQNLNFVHLSLVSTGLRGKLQRNRHAVVKPRHLYRRNLMYDLRINALVSLNHIVEFSSQWTKLWQNAPLCSAGCHSGRGGSNINRWKQWIGTRWTLILPSVGVGKVWKLFCSLASTTICWGSLKKAQLVCK